nr:uncharacterized protein LOC115271032 [Aedes albopictus]
MYPSSISLQEWFNVVIALLTAFLLLSSSTLVAITVLVTTELGPRKLTAATSTLATGISGSIGLSWFLPTLCATSTPLVYSVMFETPDHWWHTTDSFGFILFIVIESLFVILFLLLFLTLMKKLLYLAKKHDKHNTSILRRIGLLYRTAMLFVSNVLYHTFYLVYLNSEDLLSGYAFSASSIILGSCILFSFVIKAEVKHESESTSSKSSTKNSLDDNCCSGSINSPLSFYTTQDLDKDNECLPSCGKTTKIPLTILPSPHSQQHQPQQQQMVQPQQKQLPTHITTIEPCIHGDGHSIETFLGGSIPTAGTTTICNIVAHEYETSPAVVATASHGLCNFSAKPRCYEATSAVPPVSSGGVIGQFDWHQPQSAVVGLVPCGVVGGGAFTVQSGASTGMCYVTQQHHQQQQETNEFVGVGGLDILKGVGQDSIIGIRSKGLDISEPATGAGSKKLPPPVLDPISAQQHSTTGPAIASVQPVGPQPTTAPVITVTGAEDPDHINGMLDRISHDLDYLLNRTSEVPTVVSIQLRPPGGSPSASSSNNISISSNNNVNSSGSSSSSSGGPASDSVANQGSGCGTVPVGTTHSMPPPPPPPCTQKVPLISSCHSVHEVIIEESEEVDS